MTHLIDDDAECTGCWECDPDHYTTEHLKWIADGLETLPDVVHRMREIASYLEGLSKEGWELVQPVDGGWLNLERPPCPGG